jgi:hypothetical protein
MHGGNLFVVKYFALEHDVSEGRKFPLT